MRTLAILILALLPLAIPQAQACGWDSDTLAMERARFPEANELIAGYFVRHSAPYYQWRVDRISKIPNADRTPGDFNDIAVAYDKLGQHDLAIQTMLDKFKHFPDENVYETHANLGTFYIHAGQLEEGVQYIGSAIEINPEAHFGREIYQKLLVEYVLAMRENGRTLPLSDDLLHPEGLDPSDGFAAFVIENQKFGDADYQEQLAEIDRAIKGVLGMMRFGNYDSPILLEALGDLLLGKSGGTASPQRLAARAYLKAAMETESEQAITLYREKARTALSNQKNAPPEEVESELLEEIAAGDAYYAQIEADEKAWIAAGKDVDAEFAKAYYESPSIAKTTSQPGRLLLVGLLVGIGLLTLVALVVSRLRRA